MSDIRIHSGMTQPQSQAPSAADRAGYQNGSECMTRSPRTLEIRQDSEHEGRRQVQRHAAPEVFRARQPVQSSADGRRRLHILVHPEEAPVSLIHHHAWQSADRLAFPLLSDQEMARQQAMLDQMPDLEELVGMVREQDEEALELLAKQLRPLVLSIFSQYGLRRFVAFDDWQIECLTMLHSACSTYHPAEGSTFAGYVKTVFKNRALRYCRDHTRKGRECAGITFSDLERNGSDSFQAQDLVDSGVNHTEEIQTKIKFDAFLEEVRKNHSERAAQIMLQRARGYQIQEIAEDYDTTPAAVSALFSRLRRLYRSFDTQYDR